MEAILPLVPSPAQLMDRIVPLAQKNFTAYQEQLRFAMWFRHLGEPGAELPGGVDGREHQLLVMSTTGVGASGWVLAPPTQDNAWAWGVGGFQVALRLRLRLPIIQLTKRALHCVACNEPLDVSHCLRCKRFGVLSLRHDVIRDIVAKHAVRVGYCGEGVTGDGALHVVREVNLGFGGLERMDVECARWRKGGGSQPRVCGIDVTVTHPLSARMMGMQSLPELGAQARAAGQQKKTKYKRYTEGRQTHIFSAFPIEAYGRFGKEALEVVEDMAQSQWVLNEWADARGVAPRAARILYRARVLQDLSTRLMQVTVGACVLHRVREALGAEARLGALRGVRMVDGRAVLRVPEGAGSSGAGASGSGASGSAGLGAAGGGAGVGPGVGPSAGPSGGHTLGPV